MDIIPNEELLKVTPAFKYDVALLQYQLSDSVSKIHIDIASLRILLTNIDNTVKMLITELQTNKTTFDTELKSVVEKRELKCAFHSTEIEDIRNDIDESKKDRVVMKNDINTLKMKLYAFVISATVLVGAFQIGLNAWYHHMDSDKQVTTQSK